MTREGRTLQIVAAFGLAAAVAACGRGTLGPASLDSRNELCQSCRMAVSEARFAAQLVAAGEEPKFFDDIGCLVTYLREHAGEAGRSIAYVADHRTKAWVPAARATFVRADRVETPMGSHLIAFVDPGSRDADSAAAGGTPVTPAGVFGAAGPPAAGLDREGVR